MYVYGWYRFWVVLSALPYTTCRLIVAPIHNPNQIDARRSIIIPLSTDLSALYVNRAP